MPSLHPYYFVEISNKSMNKKELCVDLLPAFWRLCAYIVYVVSISVRALVNVEA